jgi:hypothetical protein
MRDQDPLPHGDDDDLLAGMPAEVEPPAELRAQVVDALRAQGLVRGARAPRVPLAYWALSAAAVLAAFLAGRASGDGLTPRVPEAREIAVVSGTPGLAIPEGSSAWAFLLYEDGRFDAGDRRPDEVARAYDAWGRAAAARGVMLLGEKFSDEETLLVGGEARSRPLGVVAPPGTLGGIFIVAAPTREAALALARETPHHEMGGMVLMREIDRVPR